jgi:hypothetical protein
MAKIETVSLLNRATLTVGTSGVASVATTINPRGNIAVSDADLLQDIQAIPLRSGTSDVVVREQSFLPAQSGLEAQAAHYARNGGRISANKKNYTVIGFDGASVFTVRDSRGRVSKIDINKTPVSFGFVRPAFDERRTSTVRLELEKADGNDALRLRADLSASASVGYTVILADASQQHAIAAELVPHAAITNGTDRRLENMSVELKLNEPQARPRMARAASFALESAAPVADVQESSTGIITMPIRSGDVTLQPGETRNINFAAAVVGKPNAKDLAFAPVTLDMRLAVTTGVVPSTETGAVAGEAKVSPDASYQMSATAEARPAGVYKLFDGADLVTQPHSEGRFTPKGESITIDGGTFRQVMVRYATKTLDYVKGEEHEVPGEAAVGGNVVRKAFARTDEYSVVHTLDLVNTSKHARDIEVTIDLSIFKSTSDLTVTRDGQALSVTKKKGLLTVVVPMDADGKAGIEVRCKGTKAETVHRAG